jgi:hypothetical protein
VTFAGQLADAFTPIAAVYDDPSIAVALMFGQTMVTNYCNQTFELVEDDIAIITPQRYRTAVLPQIPVVSVSLVEGLLPRRDNTGSGMQWIELPNVAVVAETGLLYDTTGQPGVSWVAGPSWPQLPGSLKVTYTHGYSTIPDDLIVVAIRFAQQYLENPTLQMQRRAGDIEDRFAGSVGLVITQLDRMILGRYTDIGVA